MTLKIWLYWSLWQASRSSVRCMKHSNLRLSPGIQPAAKDSPVIHRTNLKPIYSFSNTEASVVRWTGSLSGLAWSTMKHGNATKDEQLLCPHVCQHNNTCATFKPHYLSEFHNELVLWEHHTILDLHCVMVNQWFIGLNALSGGFRHPCVGSSGHACCGDDCHRPLVTLNNTNFQHYTSTWLTLSSCRQCDYSRTTS